MGPVLVNDPAFLLLYSASICGSCVSSRPPFLLSAGVAILILVTAHETKPAWYYFLGSSPICALLIRSRCSLGGRHFVFCFGYHALHKPSPNGLGCSCALAYVSLFFVHWLPTVVAHASVAEFDVTNSARAFPGSTFVHEPPLRRICSISS